VCLIFDTVVLVPSRLLVLAMAVILQNGQEQLARLVDDLLRHEASVVEPVPSHLRNRKLLTGMIVAGGDRIINVLHVPELMADRQRGIQAGADAYLVKDAFEDSRLLEIVRSLLQPRMVPGRPNRSRRSTQRPLTTGMNRMDGSTPFRRAQPGQDQKHHHQRRGGHERTGHGQAGPERATPWPLESEDHEHGTERRQDRKQDANDRGHGSTSSEKYHTHSQRLWPLGAGIERMAMVSA